MAQGLDFDAVAYLNPAAMDRCCSSGVSLTRTTTTAYSAATCRGVFRGMWKAGVAYALGDVVYICSDYEEPSSENLWRARRTHCAVEEDRPESGVNWARTWQVRLRPGQPDVLEDLEDI
jgi:hypothetical protein